MHIHHPDIAARWDAEYGGTIKPKKKAYKKALEKHKARRGNAPRTRL
jgi:hypothetical protein